jgi:outer membrane protein assembly factor BamD (BamD/ComL family)
LIAELDDLSLAPPPVLSVICKASFNEEDYSRAKEILEIFKARFEESDFTKAAYKLRAYDLFTANDLDDALAIIKDTQALYGTDPDVAWAQVLKGRVELRKEDFDAARESLQAILTVRSWRGEPYAEACYYLGQVEETAGDPRKAFGWYQRTYFQYKGHANGKWAADAYLASARCLQSMGRENDRRNTYRAMLFDPYVNQLPQADEARTALGMDEVMEINQMLAAGSQTNITVTIDVEESE